MSSIKFSYSSLILLTILCIKIIELSIENKSIFRNVVCVQNLLIRFINNWNATACHCFEQTCFKVQCRSVVHWRTVEELAIAQNLINSSICTICVNSIVCQIIRTLMSVRTKNYMICNFMLCKKVNESVNAFDRFSNKRNLRVLLRIKLEVVLIEVIILSSCKFLYINVRLFDSSIE